MFDNTRSPLPPVVVVPTSGGAEADRRVELWEDHGGRLVLYCYSDVDRLHELYRADCPWAVLDLDQVAAVRDHVALEMLLLDASPGTHAVPPVPPLVPGQRSG